MPADYCCCCLYYLRNNEAIREEVQQLWWWQGECKNESVKYSRKALLSSPATYRHVGRSSSFLGKLMAPIYFTIFLACPPPKLCNCCVDDKKTIIQTNKKLNGNYISHTTMWAWSFTKGHAKRVCLAVHHVHNLLENKSTPMACIIGT